MTNNHNHPEPGQIVLAWGTTGRGETWHNVTVNLPLDTSAVPEELVSLKQDFDKLFPVHEPPSARPHRGDTASVNEEYAAVMKALTDLAGEQPFARIVSEHLVENYNFEVRRSKSILPEAAREGYLDVTQKRGRGGKPSARKYYHITEKGQQLLDDYNASLVR